MGSDLALLLYSGTRQRAGRIFGPIRVLGLCYLLDELGHVGVHCFGPMGVQMLPKITNYN
jgi:hypothetical protein